MNQLPKDSQSRRLDAHEKLCELITDKLVSSGLLQLSNFRSTDINEVRASIAAGTGITVKVEVEATFDDIAELCDALDESEDGRHRKSHAERASEEQRMTALLEILRKA